MVKAGTKFRDIRFRSMKNGCVMIVHSAETRAFCKYVEERTEVVSYEVGKALDPGRLKAVSRVDIRGEFFKQEWETDVYLQYEDGTVGIREVVRRSDLDKRAEIEKLELSRRYWKLFGVTDWKVVVME